MDHVGGDTDLFLHRADLQRNIDAQLIVHLKYDVGRREGLETSGGCRETVCANRQGEEVVGAVRGRGRYLAKVGLYVRDLHFSASYDRLCLVMNHARDRAG